MTSSYNYRPFLCLQEPETLYVDDLSDNRIQPGVVQKVKSSSEAAKKRGIGGKGDVTSYCTCYVPWGRIPQTNPHSYDSSKNKMGADHVFDETRQSPFS
jgi:hypothetical protein